MKKIVMYLLLLCMVLLLAGCGGNAVDSPTAEAAQETAEKNVTATEREDENRVHPIHSAIVQSLLWNCCRKISDQQATAHPRSAIQAGMRWSQDHCWQMYKTGQLFCFWRRCGHQSISGQRGKRKSRGGRQPALIFFGVFFPDAYDIGTLG